MRRHFSLHEGAHGILDGQVVFTEQHGQGSG
jgi:hypothetical protein